MRSSFKGPYINPVYQQTLSDTEFDTIIILDKASRIPNHYVNATCLVYNGQTFRSIFITQEMLGFRFGDFIITKKRCIYRIKKRKKK